ncbi:hypothetical protein QE392_003187 [Microbacterium proteolyticum]|nr:hypothetical protein [Microbacterium sp. SORGH_AS_0344]MDQ1171383.1 hypothetical protein [Microbacterium proteolyticum]
MITVVQFVETVLAGKTDCVLGRRAGSLLDGTPVEQRRVG